MPVSFPYQRTTSSTASPFTLSDRRADVLKNASIHKLNSFEACRAFRYNFTYMGPWDSIKNALYFYDKSDALNAACLAYLHSFSEGRKYLEHTGESWKAEQATMRLLGAMEAGDREDLMMNASIESKRFVLLHPGTGLRLALPTAAIFPWELQFETAEMRGWSMTLTSQERQILFAKAALSYVEVAKELEVKGALHKAGCRWKKAAKCYTSAGQQGEARSAWQRSAGAFRAYALLMEKDGFLYQPGYEWTAAAEVYWEAGQPGDAAEAWAAAARAFTQANELGRAADAAQKAYLACQATEANVGKYRIDPGHAAAAA